MQHEPGLGMYEPGAQATGPSYYHSNLIGTNEAMTGPPAQGTGIPPVTRRTVYTAFGEPVYEGGIGVPPVDSRYGYAGAYGYQEGTANDPLAALGWLHVGHRYYDPSAGRFIQRDPIGIFGGLNTYEYCESNPVNGVDPFGLDRWVCGTGHLYIVVYDRGAKMWQRIDFGPWGGIPGGLAGFVCVGLWPGLVTVTPTLPPGQADQDIVEWDHSSSYQDSLLLNAAKQMAKGTISTPGYSSGFNCRSFAYLYARIGATGMGTLP